MLARQAAAADGYFMCASRKPRNGGGVGNPRGLTMNVGPGTREGLVRPDPDRRPCELRPPGLTHTLAYFTHVTRVADEVLHARGYIRPHAALLIAAMPPVLTDAAAAALLAAAALPTVLADAAAAAVLALGALPPVLAKISAATAVLALGAPPPVRT